MHLIQHNIGKVPEQLAPARVIGQDSRVEHVGVGDEDARLAPGRRPRRRPRIAIVCGHQTAVQPEAFQVIPDTLQLIVRQSLGRKEEQRGLSALQQLL